MLRRSPRAVEWARRGDYLVTVGINPTRPEVGYGYIKAGEMVIDTDGSSCKVDRFVEKPDREKALQYLSEGIYYWNSGIFVWRTRAVLDGLKKHMEHLYGGLKEIDLAMSAGDFQAVAQIFTGLDKVSIDYGLMEKADNVLMVKADFAWDDVGTWGSLRRVMELDENGNYRSGRTICVDTKDCVVCAEGRGDRGCGSGEPHHSRLRRGRARVRCAQRSGDKTDSQDVR